MACQFSELRFRRVECTETASRRPRFPVCRTRPVATAIAAGPRVVAARILLPPSPEASDGHQQPPFVLSYPFVRPRRRCRRHRARTAGLRARALRHDKQLRPLSMKHAFAETSGTRKAPFWEYARRCPPVAAAYCRNYAGIFAIRSVEAPPSKQTTEGHPTSSCCQSSPDSGEYAPNVPTLFHRYITACIKPQQACDKPPCADWTPHVAHPPTGNATSEPREPSIVPRGRPPPRPRSLRPVVRPYTWPSNRRAR